MTDQNNSNPSPDNFDDIEIKQELERKESLFPKKEDGSVDIDALSTEQAVDYWKGRHDASTTGFHKYMAKTTREIADLKSQPAPTNVEVQDAVKTADTLEDFEAQFANFDELDDDTQSTLRTIFNTNLKNTHKILDNDPAIRFARENFNEKKWEDGFNEVIASNPDFKRLLDRKSEFKAQHFQKNNVPDNISDILTQLAKIFLYDNVKADGVEEGKILAERMTTNKASGGDKVNNIGRTLDQWEEMRLKNPQKFASLSKEYKEQRNRGDFQS